MVRKLSDKALDELQMLAIVLDSGMIKSWDLAIDGGANAGTWTVEMAKRFTSVMAFEPGAAAFARLTRVQAKNPNIIAINKAILDRQTVVSLVDHRAKAKTTSLYVKEDPTGTIQATTIDREMPASRDCGLIKLDLEGAEMLALKGALQTVRRCRPVLIVEFWRHFWRFGYTPRQIQAMIFDLGYKIAMERGPNKVFIPA